MSEKFGYQELPEVDGGNAIWQCPKVVTCQVTGCELVDYRSGEAKKFNVFFVVPDKSDWAHELERIAKKLGYFVNSYGYEKLNSLYADSYDMHLQGK